MTAIFTFIFAIFGFLGTLVLSNFQGAQSKSRDVIAQTDINAVYQKLEEYYNEKGFYPTESQIETEGSTLFPGIDAEALIDNNGLKFNEPGGDYRYKAEECSNSECQGYTITADFEDGRKYTKESLN